jgi:hypothetical protein
MAVDKAIAIPRSQDSIVLLDYGQSKVNRFRNLLRCRPDGQVVWTADLPGGDIEAYVDVSWDGDKLSATSWSGYKVLIDPSTGKVTGRTFVK